MKEKYAQLRDLVEKTLGVPLRTPRDFELLSKQIFHRTRQSLSVSTLKRFWGYIDKGRDETHVRISTLDILSEYVGFQNWSMFCRADVDGPDDSCTMVNRHLFVEEMPEGTLVELRWQPGRCITIRHEGSGQFTIVESVRSKLKSGDTFQCSHIVEGFPLVLFNLMHEDTMVGNYVCGKANGVMFALKRVSH